jgi:hypothetical protein
LISRQVGAWQFNEHFQPPLFTVAKMDIASMCANDVAGNA